VVVSENSILKPLGGSFSQKAPDCQNKLSKTGQAPSKRLHRAVLPSHRSDRREYAIKGLIFSSLSDMPKPLLKGLVL
jgi:hypothetical protein